MSESLAADQIYAPFIQMVCLIPGLPLAAFLINGLFGRRWLRHATGWIAVAPMTTSAAIAIGVVLEVLRRAAPRTVGLYPWIPGGRLQVNVAAPVDSAS